MGKRLFCGTLAAALLAASLTGCAGRDAKQLYEKGAAALTNQDYESAESYFRQVVDAGHYVSEAWRGIGIAQLFEQSYADAGISFEKSLLEVDGQDREYQRDVNLYLAHTRELQGQDSKALDIYTSLLDQNPDADVLFLRGRLYLRQNDSQAAEADFDRAVSLSQDYMLYINIFEVYADEDKSGDGSRYLEEALANAGDEDADYYHQGLINYYLQDYDSAKDCLVKAIKANPDDLDSLFLLGKVYLSTSDLANARAVYQDYTDNADSAAGAYNGLALCDLAEENYDSALSNIETGLEKNPDGTAEQALLYNEIVAYEKKADWTTARQKAVSYVAKYPTDEAGLREYEFLSTR